MKKSKDLSLETRLGHMGRNPRDYYGIVNPPVVRTSTIIYPKLENYEDPNYSYRYSREGNPHSAAFEKAIAELEGGYNAISTCSGLAAVTLSLMSFLESGDHALIADCIYKPTRDFCNRALKRFGVECEFYNPLIGSDIKDLIRPNTKIIYMESPGSSCFELMDVPAITAQAKKHGIITIVDNSWSAGMLFRPIEHGADVSLMSATKYICGHGDGMLGVVTCANEEIYKTMRQVMLDQGVCAGSEELNIGLRGLRTLAIRMQRNVESAAKVVEYLSTRKEIQKIYYPALPDHPGHEVWKRDFNGANGVFSIHLQDAPKEAVTAFVDGLELFPIGSSWGGYESLLQPQYLSTQRVAPKWDKKGYLLRFQIGFEDPDDLIADFDQAFDKFNTKR